MKCTITIVKDVPAWEALISEIDSFDPSPFWLYDNNPLARVRDNGRRLTTCTTAGNRVDIEDRGDTLRISINSRRHALRDSGNVAGAALHSLGLFRDGVPSPLAATAKVESCQSSEPDWAWYDVREDHHPDAGWWNNL